MTIILIENNVPFHYEVIESVIVKFEEIIRQRVPDKKIVLKIRPDKSFENYICKRYPDITLLKQSKTPPYSYKINCTIYPKDVSKIKLNSKTDFYISHKVSDRLKQYSNIFFLTPLCNSNRFIYADVLPFMKNVTRNNIPIYVVQGHFNEKRRDFTKLAKIMEATSQENYIVKIIGKGNRLPEVLIPYRDKIVIKKNLSFEAFHREMLDCYCLFTLTDPVLNSGYYQSKLTSSVNYVRAYGFSVIIDRKLQNIYKFSDTKAYVYNNLDEMLDQFKTSLKDFKNNKMQPS